MTTMGEESKQLSQLGGATATQLIPMGNNEQCKLLENLSNKNIQQVREGNEDCHLKSSDGESTARPPAVFFQNILMHKDEERPSFLPFLPQIQYWFDNNLFYYFHTILVKTGSMSFLDRWFENHTVLLSKELNQRIHSFGGICRYLGSDRRFCVSQNVISLIPERQHVSIKRPKNKKLRKPLLPGNQFNLNPNAKEFIPHQASHAAVSSVCAVVEYATKLFLSVEYAMEQPASVAPETKQPASVDPETKQPASVDPETKQPASVAPQTKQPASVVPETKQPASVDPERKQPAGVDYEMKQPASVDYEMKQPTGVDPEMKQSASVDPEMKQPASVDPETKQPASVDHKMKQPASVDHEIKQPASVDHEMKQPASVDHEMKLPARVDHEMKEPASVDHEMKQPARVDHEMKEPASVDHEMKLPARVDHEMKLPASVDHEMKQPASVDHEMKLPARVDHEMEQPGSVSAVPKTIPPGLSKCTQQQRMCANLALVWSTNAGTSGQILFMLNADHQHRYSDCGDEMSLSSANSAINSRHPRQSVSDIQTLAASGLRSSLMSDQDNASTMSRDSFAYTKSPNKVNGSNFDNMAAAMDACFSNRNYVQESDITSQNRVDTDGQEHGNQNDFQSTLHLAPFQELKNSRILSYLTTADKCKLQTETQLQPSFEHSSVQQKSTGTMIPPKGPLLNQVSNLSNWAVLKDPVRERFWNPNLFEISTCENNSLLSNPKQPESGLNMFQTIPSTENDSLNSPHAEPTNDPWFSKKIIWSKHFSSPIPDETNERGRSFVNINRWVGMHNHSTSSSTISQSTFPEYNLWERNNHHETTAGLKNTGLNCLSAVKLNQLGSRDVSQFRAYRHKYHHIQKYKEEANISHNAPEMQTLATNRLDTLQEQTDTKEVGKSCRQQMSYNLWITDELKSNNDILQDRLHLVQTLIEKWQEEICLVTIKNYDLQAINLAYIHYLYTQLELESNKDSQLQIVDLVKLTTSNYIDSKISEAECCVEQLFSAISYDSNNLSSFMIKKYEEFCSCITECIAVRDQVEANVYVLSLHQEMVPLVHIPSPSSQVIAQKHYKDLNKGLGVNMSDVTINLPVFPTLFDQQFGERQMSPSNGASPIHQSGGYPAILSSENPMHPLSIESEASSSSGSETLSGSVIEAHPRSEAEALNRSETEALPRSENEALPSSETETLPSSASQATSNNEHHEPTNSESEIALGNDLFTESSNTVPPVPAEDVPDSQNRNTAEPNVRAVSSVRKLQDLPIAQRRPILPLMPRIVNVTHGFFIQPYYQHPYLLSRGITAPPFPHLYLQPNFQMLASSRRKRGTYIQTPGPRWFIQERMFRHPWIPMINFNPLRRTY